MATSGWRIWQLASSKESASAAAAASIQQSHAVVGQAASEAAIDLVSTGIPATKLTRVIPVELVVRGSSGPPRR